MPDLCFESLSHNKINPFGCNFQISKFAIDNILIYYSLSIFPVKKLKLNNSFRTKWTPCMNFIWILCLCSLISITCFDPSIFSRGSLIEWYRKTLCPVPLCLVPLSKLDGPRSFREGTGQRVLRYYICDKYIFPVSIFIL